MCSVQAGPQRGKRQGPGGWDMEKMRSPWGHGEEEDRALTSAEH